MFEYLALNPKNGCWLYRLKISLFKLAQQLDRSNFGSELQLIYLDNLQ